MQQQLAKIPNEGSIHDKYAAYNEANKAVAILCNHQRTVSASHETMMLKAEEKVCLISVKFSVSLSWPWLIRYLDKSSTLPEAALEETNSLSQARVEEEKSCFL